MNARRETWLEQGVDFLFRVALFDQSLTLLSTQRIDGAEVRRDQEHEYLIKVRLLSKVGRSVEGNAAAAAAAGSSDKLIRTAEYLSKMESDPHFHTNG